MTNYYVYGAGLLYEVTETASGTNTLTYHFDYRGSTVALTDDGGNVTERIEYKAYGLMTYRVGANDTPFQFNGRYGVMTDENGLLYMRARYYNPFLCRFLNPDPSGFSGGLNFYAYANGNPVSYLDPFGLCTISPCWLTLGGVNNVATATSPQLFQPQNNVQYATLNQVGSQNGPTIGPAPNNVFGIMDMTMGSDMSPESPAAQTIGGINANLYSSVLSLPQVGLAASRTAAALSIESAALNDVEAAQNLVFQAQMNQRIALAQMQATEAVGRNSYAYISATEQWRAAQAQVTAAQAALAQAINSRMAATAAAATVSP